MVRATVSNGRADSEHEAALLHKRNLGDDDLRRARGEPGEFVEPGNESSSSAPPAGFLS